MAGVSQSCTCGMSFSLDHAMMCNLGGFPTIRHNEIRDLTASLLSEVCHNAAIEPHLQPLNGEGFHHKSANTDENSRLDTHARDFGIVVRILTLMEGFSTLMLQATIPWTCQQYTTDMNRKKRDNIVNG